MGKLDNSLPTNASSPQNGTPGVTAELPQNRLAGSSEFSSFTSTFVSQIFLELFEHDDEMM
jgi:hypothetical protein